MQGIWGKSTLQPTAIGHSGYAQIPGDFLLTFKDPVSGINSIQVFFWFCYTLNFFTPVMSFVLWWNLRYCSSSYCLFKVHTAFLKPRSLQFLDLFLRIDLIFRSCSPMFKLCLKK